MPGKWRRMYFEQIGAAQDAGPVGQATIHRLSPMTFVAADIADVIGWSIVTGVGVALVHGAVTRGTSPQDTLAYSVGAVGAALLVPVVKDSVVGFVTDVAELWERRHIQAEPETPKPRQPWLVPVMQDAKKKVRTWVFYDPPRGVTYAEVHRMCVAYVNAKRFSEAEICKAAGVSGPVFRKFSADLRSDAKQLAIKLPGNRVELTDRGKAVLSRIAFSPPPPVEWDEDR